MKPFEACMAAADSRSGFQTANKTDPGWMLALSPEGTHPLFVKLPAVHQIITEVGKISYQYLFDLKGGL